MPDKSQSASWIPARRAENVDPKHFATSKWLSIWLEPAFKDEYRTMKPAILPSRPDSSVSIFGDAPRTFPFSAVLVNHDFFR